MLGSLDGFWFGGELRYAWRDVFSSEERCGCGSRFADCASWRPVRELARRVDLDEMQRLEERLLLTRNLPRLLAAQRFGGELRRYREGLASLYRALAAHFAPAVLVDTSKAPQYAYALSGVDGIDLYVLHLVRDPRGTAYSRIRDPGGVGFATGSLLWSAWNGLAEVWGRRGRYLRVRYEDFVARPAETISGVLDLLSEQRSELPFPAPDRVLLQPNHSVAGNTIRFGSGAVTIAVNEAWKTELGTARRALVSALTWPTRPRYGYRRSGSRTQTVDATGAVESGLDV